MSMKSRHSSTRLPLKLSWRTLRLARPDISATKKSVGHINSTIMFSFLKNLFSKKAGEANLKIPFVDSPTGKIIAAKVVRVEKHPNADRLRVIHLTDGKSEIGPVVCGALNFREGDIVVLALPGATIAQNIHSDTHESFVLNKAKIRGVESQGMICAAFELGITNDPGDKPEIMVLPPGVKPGTPLA